LEGCKVEKLQGYFLQFNIKTIQQFIPPNRQLFNLPTFQLYNQIAAILQVCNLPTLQPQKENNLRLPYFIVYLQKITV